MHAEASADHGGSPLSFMNPAPDILILRDPKESRRKCSLTPLRGLEGVRFTEYAHDRRWEVGERIFLHPDGQELSSADRELGQGLFLIDCSWRRVDKLLRTVDGTLHRRRLPVLKTAYPRHSSIFADPATGLASIEALYAAVCILVGPRQELLEGYRWRDEFLERNPVLAR